MKCPACDNELTSTNAGTVTVDVCRSGCGGIWFDNFELKKLDEPDEIDALALLRIERNDSLLVDYERRRKCPKCTDVVMMRHFFSPRREVEVDECPNCGGIWLDPGELAQIRREVAESKTPAQAATTFLQRVFQGGKPRPRPSTPM